MLFSAGIDPEWGAFRQKTEIEEGLQVGSGYGYQKKVSTSLGLGIMRGHAGGLRGNVQREDRRWPWELWKGPLKGTELP